MASPDQVIQHVKFALEGLSERNAHHEFEHACRHLARYRIAFNLLPATGPVASGGDRGRDFETFPTFVGGIVDGKFSSETPKAKLVFACSLDRRVSTKVREDVTKIMAQGPAPDVLRVRFPSQNASLSRIGRAQITMSDLSFWTARRSLNCLLTPTSFGLLHDILRSP